MAGIEARLLIVEAKAITPNLRELLYNRKPLMNLQDKLFWCIDIASIALAPQISPILGVLKPQLVSSGESALSSDSERYFQKTKWICQALAWMRSRHGRRAELCNWRLPDDAPVLALGKVARKFQLSLSLSLSLRCSRHEAAKNSTRCKLDVLAEETNPMLPKKLHDYAKRPLAC